LRAARAYLYTTAAEVWRDSRAANPSPKPIALRCAYATTWTIHQSASVVDTAYHMAGGPRVRGKPVERRFRDMHAIAQQIQAATPIMKTRQGDPFGQAQSPGGRPDETHRPRHGCRARFT